MKENKHTDTNGGTKDSMRNAPKTDTVKADFPIVGIGASALQSASAKGTNYLQKRRCCTRRWLADGRHYS